MVNRDPDVRFFIRYTSDGKALDFQIIVRDPGLGPMSEGYGPSPLKTTPSEFQADLKKELEAIRHLAHQGNLEADDAQRRLASLGINLFRQLPEELQKRLWSFLGRASTIQIISDEPRIPWELTKLQNRETSGQWQDGPFLCETFAVTRWLNKMIGSVRLPLRDVALVVPWDSCLKESEAEKGDVLSLAGPERRVYEIKPVYRAITDALRSGEHDAWHFCGHSTGMHLSLQGEQYVQPRDIAAYGEGIARRQPLIFLNSCDTGDGGFYLTNLGGWAHDFLDAGAGAFLGTLWPVNDRIAREFAKDFYRRFLSGYPIAEALLQARLHVRHLIPGDPSWLAYTVFAHPFASARENQSRLPPKDSARQNNLDVEAHPTRERVHTTNPPDIRIHAHRIFLNGQVHLEFQLDSPSGALELEHHQPPGPLPLGSPEEYRLRWRRLNDRIEKLNDGLDLGDEILLEEHIKDKLDGIGRDLYLTIFPPEIKQAYRSFRKRGLSLMLVTDEHSIPWELIKPYDDSDLANFIDDGFLCLEFPMTRWLVSADAPAEEISVRRFAFLGGEAFPRSLSERQQLYALAGKYPGVEDVSPHEPTMEAFEDLLDSGSVDLLHFAGPFTECTFRPEDLHGPRASKIRHNRPLVLFNYQDGLEGWERRWIENCGCGAFVGLSWPPRDSLAYQFITTFYGALSRGQTIGCAALEARRRLYSLSPGSPAWLAYTVYAHPNSRLFLSETRAGKG